MKYVLPIRYDSLDWRKGEKAAVREQYIVEQGGKCWWCEEPLKGDPPPSITEKEIKWHLFPRGFDDSPVHLQHCHATGMTEGAVHMKCNAVMWQYYGK